MCWYPFGISFDRESPNLYPVDRKKLKNAANSDSESVTASGDK